MNWKITVLSLFLRLNDAFMLTSNSNRNVISSLTTREGRCHFNNGRIPLFVAVPEKNRVIEKGAHSEIAKQYSDKPPTKAWLVRYEELKEFRNANGDCNVLRNSNKNLGNWVQKQRAAYKAYMTMNKNESSSSSSVEISSENITSSRKTPSPLSSLQIQLLNDIDFIWNVNEWRYQLYLDKLGSFYQQNGHINIAMSTADEEQKSLYNWLRRQRDEYKKYLNGKENNLSNKRRQALEKCGFHIGMFDIGPDATRTVRTFSRSSWKGRYEELKQFENEFGHCAVPTTNEKYAQLSGWVQHQRVEKKKKDKGIKSRLSDDKEKLLDDLGFIWNRQESLWQQRFNELRKYKETHGHVRVNTKDGQLGNWVMIQRLQYRQHKKGGKNTLSNERMEALNQIGFEWDIHEASWEDKLNEVKECLNGCPDRNAIDSAIYPHRLLSWVSAQRSEKRYKLKGLHSHLTDEREKKLDEIGFDWKIEKSRERLRQELWMQNFEKLSEYTLQHETCRVPVKKSHSAEENSFSHWVRDQRRYYKAYKNDLQAPITAERVALLDSIGFADDVEL